MPWSIDRRDGEWCVVKEGESSPIPGGCHESRADAIKHQRALYANESRVASMYDELDAQPVEEPHIVEILPPVRTAAENIKVTVEIPQPEPNPLDAAVVAALDTFSRRMERETAQRDVLVAALEQVGQPIINVTSPVTVEPTPITVEAPRVTVEAPQVTVEAPQVTVEVPAQSVPDRKGVVFNRDQAGRIVSATLEDE